MIKADIERIKRIERIQGIAKFEEEYVQLMKELDNEVKKEKLKYFIDRRQAREAIPLHVLDELIASLDSDEDKLELINIADTDGKVRESKMFNKTILSLSTDEEKILAMRQYDFFCSIGQVIASLSSDELKLEQLDKLLYINLDHLGIIIASLDSDELKLSQLEQNHKEMYESRGLAWYKIVKSLNSDVNKLQAMEKYKDLFEDNLGEIIASLSSDELKLEQLDKFYIQPGQLGRIIASLGSDELKLEQLDKFQDRLYRFSRTWGVSEGFSIAIKSLSDDEIKCQAVHKYKEYIDNKGEIILSLSTDEAKCKLIEEIGYLSGNIIASLCDDKNKIKLMKEHIKELDSYSLRNIIKSIESDEEKIKLLQILGELIKELPENVERYDIRGDIIETLSTDEARLKYIELGMEKANTAFLSLETDEAKLKVMELLNDEKYSKNIIRRLGEKNDIIRKIVLSLNTNEKKIEALLMVQDDIDKEIVRKIVATLDYYDDFPEENIIIKLSSGARITANNKTLNIPIERIMNSEDAEYFHDCYFKYFNSEMANNQQIFQSTDEEMRDFLKFANTLGCFSKDKVLDEDGRETEVYLGQKASSLLAQLLKTDELRIRTISWTI